MPMLSPSLTVIVKMAVWRGGLGCPGEGLNPVFKKKKKKRKAILFFGFRRRGERSEWGEERCRQGSKNG